MKKLYSLLVLALVGLLVGSELFAATAPSIQASNIGFSGITVNPGPPVNRSVNILFRKGNGAKRVVVFSEAAPVSLSTVATAIASNTEYADAGGDYSAGTTVGDYIVIDVLAGNARSSALTNLPGTGTIYVLEYNTDGNPGADGNVAYCAATATSNPRTVYYPEAAVSGYAAGNLQATQAKLQWTPISGAVYYELTVSTDADLTNVVNYGAIDAYDVGAGNLEGGKETWYVSGLYPAITYYFGVQAYYANGTSTSLTGPFGTFTTSIPDFSFTTDQITNVTDELEWSINKGVSFTPVLSGQLDATLTKNQRESVSAANDIIVRYIGDAVTTPYTIDILDDQVAPSTTINFSAETTTDALASTVEYYVDHTLADSWLTVSGNACNNSVVSVQPETHAVGTSKYFHYRTKGTGVHMPKAAVASLEIPARPATPTSPTCLIAVATESLVFNFQNSATGLEVQKNTGEWADATVSASGFLDAPSLAPIAVNDVINARVKAVANTSFHSENLSTTAKARPFGPTTADFTFTPGADQYKLTGVTDAMEYQYQDGGMVWTSVPALATSVQLDATAETKAGLYIRYKQDCGNSTAISDNQTINFGAAPGAPSFCAAESANDYIYGISTTTILEGNVNGGTYYPVVIDNSNRGYLNNAGKVDFAATNTIALRTPGNHLTKSGTATAPIAAANEGLAPTPTVVFAVNGEGNDVLRVTGAATMEYSTALYTAAWTSIGNDTPFDILLSNLTADNDFLVRTKCNAGTPPSAVQTFNIIENATVPTITIADATGDKLYGLPTTAGTTMEARIGTTGAWTSIVVDANGVADFATAASNVVYVRYKATISGSDYTKPSVSASVTAQDEATAPSVTFTFTAGATANQIVGTTTAMEYSLTGGATWISCDADATTPLHANISAENNILVRYKQAAPAPFSLETEFDIVAGPGAPTFTLADAGRDMLFGLPANQALGVLEANLEATAYSPIATSAAGTATFGCDPGHNVHVRYAAHDLTLEGTPAPQVAVNPPAFTPVAVDQLPDFSFDVHADPAIAAYQLINVNDGMEYSVDGEATWIPVGAAATTVNLAGATITPDSDIKVRNKMNGGTPASVSYTIDIIQGDVTPDHNIDFANETLATNATDEFASNDIFTSDYGNGAHANILVGAYAIPNAPAADKVIYIREMATYHTTAKSPIMVTIPARAVGPEVTINYYDEVTDQEFTSAVEWANHGTEGWYSPIAPNTESAILEPGTDMDFRTKATASAFKSQITWLTVDARPAAPVFTIDYVNEMTNEVIPTSIEYNLSSMVDLITPAGTTGPNDLIGLNPGTDLYFRIAATSTNFYGEEQHLLVKNRQAQPATVYSIDYEYETTDVAVPAVEEYADNAIFTGAVSGNDVDPANLNPGADPKTIYFRTKAIAESIDPPVVGQFHSTAITLAVPARPAAPTVNYTVNYITEQTNEAVTDNLEWSKSEIFVPKTAGMNAVIEAVPSTTYYFRYPWTAGSFGSESASYTTDDRPTAPVYTIDFINETTKENVLATIEYGFSDAYGSTGAGAPVGLTPGATPKTLYARVKAVAGVAGNYTGEEFQLPIPIRPEAVELGINYFGETTADPYDATYEYHFGTDAYAPCGGAEIELNPGVAEKTLYVRKKAAEDVNFRGFESSVTVDARPAAPAAHTIDYVAETTGEAVPATEEYSASDFEGAGTPGTGVAIAVTPGTDLYFRIAAHVAGPGDGNFHSESVMLGVPVRPVCAITANDFETWTPRDPKPALNATVDANGTLYWLHANTPATVANTLEAVACTSGVAVGTELYNGAATTTYYVAFRPTVNSFISTAVAQKVTVYESPTLHATEVNFDGAADVAPTINWTNGNGTHVMIVRQAGNGAFAWSPVNGTTYTTDEVIDANTRVVYAGTNVATYTDANATANTNYTYKAFAYNGAVGAWIYNTIETPRNPWKPLYLTGTAAPIAPSTSIESGKSYKLTILPVYRDGATYTMTEDRTIEIEATGVGVTGYTPASTTLANAQTKKEITNATIVAANGGTGVEVAINDLANGYFVNGNTYQIPVGNVVCAEPTAQATYVVFGTSTCSAGKRNIQVKFTLPTSGQGALVVAKQSTSLNEVPVDGTTYGGGNNELASVDFGTAPAFGTLGAKVIFNFDDVQNQYSSGDPLQMTNLTASSQVRVRVFMYNGAGDVSNYYSNAGTFNPRSATLSSCARLGENAPVCELSGFRARSSMGSVITNWNVTEENMVVGYTLERAEAIGENPEFTEVTSYVSNNAMAGSLTESTNKSYNFVDRSAELKVGKDYLYRLSFTNVNGEKQQLAEDMVTVVNMNTEGDQMLSVQNVRANGNTLNFDLELAQSLGVTVQIVDMTGMSVATQINGRTYPAGETKVGLDIENLTSGTYFLNVSSANGEAVVEKFVVVK